MMGETQQDPPELAELTENVDDVPSYFAFSKPAAYEYGIVYRGHWQTEADGVATAVRRNACAIRRTGLPVFLQGENNTHWNNGAMETVDYSELPIGVRREINHLVDLKHGSTVASVRHILPNLNAVQAVAIPARGVWTAEALKYLRSTTVIFTALESNVVDPEIVRWMGKVAMVWVPSDANRTWLVQSGMDGEKVKVIPHPIAFRSPMLGLTRQLSSTLRFLNIAKWEPRKAQLELIEAFLVAFEPTDDVHITLKSRPFYKLADYPEDPYVAIQTCLLKPGIAERWKSVAQALEHITVVWRHSVEPEQIVQLYREADVYVSAGRSEGYDLPAFDAKVAGLRMIHSGHGGPCTFEQPDSDIRISGGQELVPFNPWYRFGPNAKWSGYRVGELASALREAYQRRSEVCEKFDCAAFSMDAVGRKMREHLNRVCELAGIDFVRAINVDAPKRPS